MLDLSRSISTVSCLRGEKKEVQAPKSCARRQLTRPAPRLTFLAGEVPASASASEESSSESSILGRLTGVRGDAAVFEVLDATAWVCFFFKSAAGESSVGPIVSEILVLCDECRDVVVDEEEASKSVGCS